MTANIPLSLVLGAAFLLAGPVHAGTDPADACKNAKAKATGKKASDLLKAIGKNVKKADPVKLAASISKAQSRLTKSFVKAEGKGGCLTTGDVGVLEAKTDTFAMDAASLIIEGQECGNDIQEGLEECDGTDAAGCQFGCKGDCTCVVCGDDVTEGIEECDGTDDGACAGLCQINCRCLAPVCANGVLEAGEECDPPCSTGACGVGEICGVDCACVPDVACTCGSPEPTTLEYASMPVSPPATCGEVRNGADVNILDLACGESIFGGGAVGVNANQPVHIGTPTIYDVECCYGTTLALRGTTPGDTGSDRNCSTTGCSQGGPNPVVMATQPFSTCVLERFDEDMTGWADCSTGEVLFRETIRTTIFLTGDHLPTRCNGGANPGGLCQDDTDCAPGGTCDDDMVETQSCPICNPSTNLCNGGPNDGLPCMPMTPDTGAPQYPTSYDCPPPPPQEFGGTLLPHAYTTGPQLKTTTDGQFCRFCRDAEESLCFEGDARTVCPDSTLGPCKPGLGQTAGCGTPTPCETDADCSPPYESCTQRTPGALDKLMGRTIEMTGGSTAGSLIDRMLHDATIVSVDCIPPTFIPFQDNTADFPGPGAVSTAGPMQLKP